jgi:hypothetical protein
LHKDCMEIQDYCINLSDSCILVMQLVKVFA